MCSILRLVISACMALVVAESAAGARGSVTPPPGELVASVAIGPAATRGTLRVYAEAVKPSYAVLLDDGVLRLALAKAIGVPALVGLAADWMYVLVAEIDGTRSIGLLGKVADAKALTTGIPPDRIRIRAGWAVIGPPVLLDRIASYALTVIAPQRAPVASTAIVYLPQLIAHHQADLEAARNRMLGSFAMPNGPTGPQQMALLIDGFRSLAADVDRVIVTLEADSDLGSLDVAVVPRPGSRLAKFVALQRPADYALFDRFPAASPAYLGGGRLDLGPYSGGSRDIMVLGFDADTAKGLRAGLERISKGTTGEFAFEGEFSPRIGVTGRVLWRLSNAAAADALLKWWFDRFIVDHQMLPGVGTPPVLKAKPGTTVDGVSLRSYEIASDLSKLPPREREREEQGIPGGVVLMQVGVVDGLAMLVVAPDGVADATQTIHAVRGKAPRFTASTLVGRLLAWSRARRESVAFLVDSRKTVAGPAGNPGNEERLMMLSFGFADHRAHVRLAAPAATLRVNLDKIGSH